MAAGTALRNAARTVINQVGNTVKLSTITASYDVRDNVTETVATSASIIAATTNTRVPIFMRQLAGNIEAGDLIVYVKDSDTINKSDIITYQSTDYDIDELKPIYVENIHVVTVATCHKKV